MLKKHKRKIERSYRERGMKRTEGEIIREHNSTFLHWFREELRNHPLPDDHVDGDLIFALAHGPACNLANYKAYDINGYTFYTEAKDKHSEYQNSGVMMESLTSDVKERYYGRIEEI